MGLRASPNYHPKACKSKHDGNHDKRTTKDIGVEIKTIPSTMTLYVYPISYHLPVVNMCKSLF
jgi:hypothetical protein